MASISSGFNAPISRIYYSKATKQVALSFDGEHGGFVTIWFDSNEVGRLTSQFVEAYVEMIKDQKEAIVSE